MTMNIAIYGLGWFGMPMAEKLKSNGHEVSGSVTTQEKAEQLKHLNAFKLKFPDLPPQIESDILILNIPPFESQLAWFKQWKISTETKVIFISSTSVLSKNNDLIHIEEWIKTFPHWTILRFGGLYGQKRHPGNHLSGKQNLPGRLWPVNLLHLNDAIGFTNLIIDQKIENRVFNVLSSDHPSRENFYVSYCRNNGISLPDFDQTDISTKAPIDNSDAAEIYSFMPLK